jgi:hypothetical protein
VPARTPPQDQWSCHQVLVVDDDKAFAQSICDALSIVTSTDRGD